MIDWLRFVVPAFLVWAFVTLRMAGGQHRANSPARRAIMLALFSLAISMTVLTPAPYAALAELTGVPNVARLVGHSLMLVVAWAIHIFVLSLNRPNDLAWPSTHRYTAGMVLTFVGMAVTFLLADLPVDDVRFAGRYSGQPWVLEYWLVFLCYMLPAFWSLVGNGWRLGGLAANPLVRLGMRLIALGSLAAFVYHVHKALVFASDEYHLPYPEEDLTALDKYLTPASALLALAGVMMPVLGQRLRLPELFEWLHRYRTYHTLRPLWLALYRANPHIALEPPASRLSELLMPGDIELRLYRRVIEIRDGRLALQPFVDDKVAEAARERAQRDGATGQALEVATEAAVLAAALRASERPTPAPGPHHPPAEVPGGGDLDSDMAFLSEVARAYRRA
ncbi:MAB_1171c family putative transporter [Allokutzneria oryzae]|uniref:MAB_1171c family putative transporter n=1 Tax=Allokutzneria oryzae TaxID=1378989 RepID=A0ABV5ZXP3_9PSEU